MNDDTFVGRLGTPPETALLGVIVPIPEPWAALLVDWRCKVGELLAPISTCRPPPWAASARLACSTAVR